MGRRLRGHPAGPHARPLFLGGAPRSGTTALANYLNRHHEILICRERYKFLDDRKITPRLFSFERILDYRPGETNQAREAHVRLLRRRDPENVKWVGDKNPRYVRRLRLLTRNNPEARFIVMYRPLAEVAGSFEARASDPDDHWPSEDGFEAGIGAWNSALRHTRRYIERSRGQRLLVLDYGSFFADPESFIPLLSRFLELEFDERVRRAWRNTSASFEGLRRSPRALTDRQRKLVEERKDHDAERWVLDYMRRQVDFAWRRRPSLWERTPLPF